MKFLQPKSDEFKKKHAALYAKYEIAYTFVDFLSAGLFTLGSLLFFQEATTHIATWMFLFGSICFALKPTIRLIREVHYLQLGDYETLAKRTDD
ncbi:MAG: YrhK family protein [Anaerolineae bacterium]|nr:YrhK family protein [Anaerolineae bacterium]